MQQQNCTSTVTRPAGARLGKLIRLLASDKPGEVAATAQAIERTLRSAGLDFHSLASVVERQLDLAPAPQQAPSEPRSRRSGRLGKLRLGDRVICDEPGGVFRACRCGSSRFTVEPGAGPHVAQLRCEACGACGRWLSRQYLEGAAP
jgi:hypothetical protein